MTSRPFFPRRRRGAGAEVPESTTSLPGRRRSSATSPCHSKNLLRTGRPGASVLDVARDLLRSTGGLAGLISSNGNLLRQRGVGAVKASSVLAAVELGQRLVRAKVVDRDLLDQPAAVARFVQLRYGSQDQEIMGALYLDVRNRLIAESDNDGGLVQAADRSDVR
jgi:DNA repair protein RadC